MLGTHRGQGLLKAVNLTLPGPCRAAETVTWPVGHPGGDVS
jgi:hypothetical protein